MESEKKRSTVDKKIRPIQIFLYSLPLFPLLAIFFAIARYFDIALFLGLLFLLEISFVFVLNARGKKVLISHLIEMSNISENKRALCIGSKKNPLSLAVEKWDNISVQEEAPQKSQENFDLILTDSMGNIPNAIERERVLITLNKVLKENGRLVLCDKLDRIRAYVTILNQMHWNDIEIEQNSYTTITPYAILTANKPGTLTE